MQVRVDSDGSFDFESDVDQIDSDCDFGFEFDHLDVDEDDNYDIEVKKKTRIPHDFDDGDLISEEEEESFSEMGYYPAVKKLVYVSGAIPNTLQEKRL
ncbi:hypothetical protein ACH5RR_015217 [Cinchona calisaya]|uniref:Uncharacterized protein n=1 Tax=Cinchona calisaya TaxID=153742 RepID=A0ABD2ZTQ2_9GENT